MPGDVRRLTLGLRSRGSRLSGPLLRKLLVAVVAALPMACGLLAAPPPASASTQYFVTVSDLEGQFDQAPENIEIRVSPALPPGAELTGSATCGEVYKPGSGETESVYSFPAPGSYQFVTSSCKSDEGDPLTLHGASGSLQILGGVFNIKPNPTLLAAVAAEGESASHEPTVAFAAEVVNKTLDDSPIAEQGLLFTFEKRGGLPSVACEAESESLERLDETGKSVAACKVEGQTAKEIEEGDGVWTAHYSGTTDFAASSTQGQVPGKESVTQANQELQEAWTKDSITIVAKQIPPNCERHEESVGLINVSLGELNCTELKILQYTTQACLLATAVIGGETAITGVTAAIAKQLAKVALKVALEQAAPGGGTITPVLETVDELSEIDEAV